MTQFMLSSTIILDHLLACPFLMFQSTSIINNNQQLSITVSQYRYIIILKVQPVSLIKHGWPFIWPLWNSPSSTCHYQNYCSPWATITNNFKVGMQPVSTTMIIIVGINNQSQSLSTTLNYHYPTIVTMPAHLIQHLTALLNWSPGQRHWQPQLHCPTGSHSHPPAALPWVFQQHSMEVLPKPFRLKLPCAGQSQSPDAACRAAELWWLSGDPWWLMITRGGYERWTMVGSQVWLIQEWHQWWMMADDSYDYGQASWCFMVVNE